jgi:uncharacterized protein YaaQ
MKLVIIIAQKSDSKKLEEVLVENEFQLTRFEGMGGYLKKKNSTFFVGTDDEKVESLIDLVKKICQVRKEVVTAPSLGTGLGESLITNGTKIQTGGATIFTMNIENFLKI